jgi:hypothetical protein
MTTSLVVGRSRPGCGLCPALSFKDLHHPCWEGGRGELGPTSVWAGRKASSSSAEEASSSHAGEGKLLLLDKVQLSVLHPGRWSCRARADHIQVLSALAAAQHVVRHEGGTRVLGQLRSRSRGENGSEDLPVRFGATAARWCGVGGQVAAVVGAKVVAARGGCFF